MLTIKRRKAHTIRTSVPSHNAVEVQKAVDAVIHSIDPAKSLAAIRPAKSFIKAKLNGSSHSEAKALAGIRTTLPTKKIFETPVTQLILEEVLSQEEDFSDRGIVKRLKEMWDCKETAYVPVGHRVIKKKKANWDVRKFAFSNVLELRGYKRKKEDGDGALQATQIIFNVTPIPQGGAVPVDVPGEVVE